MKNEIEQIIVNHMCVVRPDLVDCGLRIPVGDGYEYITEDDYQNFPYRWVGDDIFQVFFKGEWKMPIQQTLFSYSTQRTFRCCYALVRIINK